MARFILNIEFSKQTLSMEFWCEIVLKLTEILLGNPTHTNQNIPSNLYWAKIECVLL